jgi:hypothetical protein
MYVSYVGNRDGTGVLVHSHETDYGRYDYSWL